MENQQQPQPPLMSARPWFRLASIRTEQIPVAAPTFAPPVPAPRPPQPAPAPAPAPAPVPAPAPERPLLRIGSLLRIGAPLPPTPQEPIQAPPQPQTRTPTPPPPALASPPPPGVPSSTASPLAAAPTQDQQPPREALPSTGAPSRAVRAPSPPAPLSEALSPAVRPQQQQPPPPPPITAVSPPPMMMTVVSPAPAPAPSPRLPSPPLHPEPETKPMVTVVTAQPAFVQEPTSSPYKNKTNNINGNGGKTKLGVTHGEQLRGATPPPPSPTGTTKKPEPAAAHGKKKPGATDEAESRMRALTLAGENMGAYMNLGGGGKAQGRHLTQTQPAQGVQNVSLAAAPGSNGVTSPTDHAGGKASMAASKWKKGAASAKPMAALVNSNVQSVNNSIMFNSSCVQQSPGVHITLSSGSRRLSPNRLLGDQHSNGNGSGGGTAASGAGDDRRIAN